jgi:hypothetical protein
MSHTDKHSRHAWGYSQWTIYCRVV